MTSSGFLVRKPGIKERMDNDEKEDNIVAADFVEIVDEQPGNDPVCSAGYEGEATI